MTGLRGRLQSGNRKSGLELGDRGCVLMVCCRVGRSPMLDELPLSSAESIASARPAPPLRSIGSQIALLVIIYLPVLVLSSMTISLCGPGCCFVFYAIIALASGLLMFRRPFFLQVFCLLILWGAIGGMWHEKQTRDTWANHALRVQLEDIQSQQKQADSTNSSAHLNN
jgi:hypothetical protein